MIGDRHDLAYAPPWLMLRIDFEDGRALSPGKVRLLEPMWEAGPISTTGRAIGMSRRRAGLLVEALKRIFRQVMAIALGGGAALIARYSGMEAAAAVFGQEAAGVGGQCLSLNVRLC